MHYHFGTKDELLRAVLRERGVDLVAEVRRRAKELADSPNPGSSRDLARMLAEPYVRSAHGGEAWGTEWIRLLSQLLQTDPDWVIDRKTAKATAAAVARVYPAGPIDIERAVRMCFTLLIVELAHPTASRRGRRPVVDLELLVDFLSGGLETTLGNAPVSSDRTA
jgi:AcrR family transcriptional regulator